MLGEIKACTPANIDARGVPPMFANIDESILGTSGVRKDRCVFADIDACLSTRLDARRDEAMLDDFLACSTTTWIFVEMQ
jgi:hypothetical protein